MPTDLIGYIRFISRLKPTSSCLSVGLIESICRLNGGRPIKANRLVKDVLVPAERPIAVIEALIVMLVILSTATLGVEPSVLQPEDRVVNRIQGIMILSTASSMEAFGLDEFERGATATIDLTVRPAESRTCASCITNWTGLNIAGEVIITELYDEAGRLGRIEATINITYLVKHSSSDLISREWLLVDWDAGDASSHSEIIIVHNPPRWLPAEAVDAAFVSRYGELQSRTGPHITVEDIGGGMLRSSGCLPDSFTCSGITLPDIDLISSSGHALAPVVLDSPVGWQELPLPLDAATSSNKLQGFRSLLDIEDSIVRQTSFCPWIDEPVISTSSWTVTENGQGTFTPLASHLSSLGLPIASIYIGAGVWTEVDLDGRSCGALIDGEGSMRLGFVAS